MQHNLKYNKPGVNFESNFTGREGGDKYQHLCYLNLPASLLPINFQRQLWTQQEGKCRAFDEEEEKGKYQKLQSCKNIIDLAL